MISQRLSLNMPRLNQNQRIQALTILARVSNVSRAFGCHRNTIIWLRQRFQQTSGVADRRRPGRPSVTNHRTDRFITLVVYIWGFWARYFTPFFPIFPSSDHFSKNLKNLKNLKKTHIFSKIYHKTHHFMIYLTTYLNLLTEIHF